MVRPDGSDPEDYGKELEPGLDDEPGSLLDFFNEESREEVALNATRASPSELELLDFLTFQLDGELIFHNVIVNTLEKRMCKVFLKSAGILEAIEELRNEKMAI